MLFSAKDYVTFQGILQTVTLVLLILNWYDGNISRHNSEQQTKIAREQLAISRAAEPLAVTPIQLEIADRIKSVESKITNIGKKLEVPEDIRQVIRDAPLRVEPDPSATIIRRVYADDRLRLLRVDGRWALVEVFEFKSESTTAGWVSRSILRRPGG